jgi:hypothetical protein
MLLALITLQLFVACCCQRNTVLPTAHHPDLSNLTFLALYFPQYYPVAENRAWLEESRQTIAVTTEWSHFHDKLPDVNRYKAKIVKPLVKYDLRDYEARRNQSEYAREIGVDAFVFYHYWLDNHAVMDSALNMMLLDGEPSLPFAFCFANEEWGGLFFGMYRDKVEMLYEMPRNHAIWLAPFLTHKNYIYKDGRPVLYVYMMYALPPAYLQAMNDALATLGIPKLYIISTMQPYFSNHKWYSHQDAAAEFPSNVPGARQYNETLDWSRLVPNSSSDVVLEEGFPIVRGIMLTWDPTPRYKTCVVCAYFI